VFIVFSSGYIFYDSNGDGQYYYPFVFHINTSGVINTYTQTNNASVQLNTTSAVLVTSTHIYWGWQNVQTTYLYRLTIGTFGSGIISATSNTGYGNVSCVFRRTTDGALFVGTTGNSGENGNTTGIAQFTSALAVVTPPFVANTFNNIGLFGAALSDGSLLLCNVRIGATNTYAGKTTTTPEGGATIAYPPYNSGSTSQLGFTSTSGQTFRAYQTMRLQKMSTGQLLVVQRNTPYQ
jgi:hypothetical protein